MNLRRLLRIDDHVWCMRYEQNTTIEAPSDAAGRRHLDGPRRMHNVMWCQPRALTDEELSTCSNTKVQDNR